MNARKGFSIIATANTRDRGVNEMSTALKRRFNIIVLPAPADLNTEIEIVKKRVSEIASSYDLQAAAPADEALLKVVTIFREPRSGMTLDKRKR